jgi:hypothetical protein
MEIDKLVTKECMRIHGDMKEQDRVKLEGMRDGCIELLCTCNLDIFAVVCAVRMPQSALC